CARSAPPRRVPAAPSDRALLPRGAAGLHRIQAEDPRHQDAGRTDRPPARRARRRPAPHRPREDGRLFDLLKRAYIDARYSPSYRITEDELRSLQDRVLD